MMTLAALTQECVRERGIVAGLRGCSKPGDPRFPLAPLELRTRRDWTRPESRLPLRTDREAPTARAGS
jgi:hypothetical protein